jgi:hypothetical protein
VDKHRVREFTSKLRDEQVRVWLDADEIRAGDNVLEKIQDGLNRSKYIVIAFTESLAKLLRASKAPWVRAEYGAMLYDEITHSSTRVIVVLLDEIQPDGVPTLLKSKRCVPATEEGFRELLACFRPLTSARFRAFVLRKPLIELTIFNGSYQVEPSDLLSVVLSEIRAEHGGPISMARTRDRSVNHAA